MDHKRIICLGLLLLLVFVLSEHNKLIQTLSNDGKGCGVCVFAITEAQKLFKSKPHLSTPLLFKQICRMPNDAKTQESCDAISSEHTQQFDEYIKKNWDADYICSKLGLCKTCHLLSDANQVFSSPTAALSLPQNIRDAQYKARVLAPLLFSQFKGLQSDQNGEGLPKRIFDLDGDYFSKYNSVGRGANWRGRDCNDWSSKVHPGRKYTNIGEDMNCNGIHGIDKETEKSFEDLFCNSFPDDRQLIFLGDSSVAGFMIPVEWLDLKNLTKVLSAYNNELDWPMKVWGSGWDDSIQSESMYHRIVSRNKCAHRQFQNVAKNGAEMKDLVEQIKNVQISHDDKPALVFIGYIGNDVCGPSLETMTPVDLYEKRLREGLESLNKKLPKNSKVVMFGLIDGAILFDHMGDLQHPIGPVKYSQFYEFLTCSGMNPCSTWLTTNSTSRALASERMRQLDGVLEKLVTEQFKFENFDLTFIDFEELIDLAFAQLDKEKRPYSDLIDAVDGFHPSILYGSRILSKFLWQVLEKQRPDFIGDINPNNEKIQSLFGDQGGH
ncbi:acyloxyacyl hydrolase [Acrasis kona]|uniref:Acyloxyacyl hydrolase n=1 Tax=Acrasis kona TaxID=1008807 RepID=A0AAW2ZMA6_9EUKA